MLIGRQYLHSNEAHRTRMTPRVTRVCDNGWSNGPHRQRKRGWPDASPSGREESEAELSRFLGFVVLHLTPSVFPRTASQGSRGRMSDSVPGGGDRPDSPMHSAVAEIEVADEFVLVSSSRQNNACNPEFEDCQRPSKGGIPIPSV